MCSIVDCGLKFVIRDEMCLSFFVIIVSPGVVEYFVRLGGFSVIHDWSLLLND